MSDFVEVHRLANQFEADILKGALETENISVLIKRFHDTAYDGIYIPQKGWGKLMVPENEKERALVTVNKILEDIEKRGRYKDPGNIDPEYWERLESADPLDVQRRGRVSYNSTRKIYEIPFLNELLCCDPENRLIFPIKADSKIVCTFDVYLVVLTYLLDAMATEPSGNLVNEKELNGGTFFFRGPHSLLTQPLAERFGKDGNGLLEKGRGLGGEPVFLADVAFKIWLLPKIPVVYMLWLEDEEFPADVLVNFDETITEHFPLDVVWASVNVLTGLLLK